MGANGLDQEVRCLIFVDRSRAGRISDIEAFTRKGHELLLRLENCRKKSMIALKTADEVIDRQAAMSVPEAVEYELSILDRLFSTHDALEGLSSAGRRKPLFIGQ